MPDSKPGEPKNPEAGARVKEYVGVAIAQSRDIHTMTDFIRATGLHPNTVYDILKGMPESPEPSTMAKFAKALKAPLGDLWARWDDREIEPASIEDALRRHTRAIAEQNGLLRDLVTFVRSAALAISEAGGDDRQIRDARVAVDAAREDSPEEPEEAPPSEPVVPFPRRTPDA